MKRLILKIQKLQAKYNFCYQSDLYEKYKFIRFIKNGFEYEITQFFDDSVSCECSDDVDAYQDLNYDELPRETLEDILDTFEQTVLENDKYNSVQYYSNI